MWKILAAAVVVTVLAAAAEGATYVSIEGLKGEATAKAHVGAIVALRFNLEVTAAETVMGAGGGAGKVEHKPLVITKEMDGISTELMRALLSRQQFKSLTLKLARESKDAEAVYYTVRLERVTISGVRQYTDERTGQNVEDVTISWGSMAVDPGKDAPPPAKVDPGVIKLPVLRPPQLR